MVGLGHVADLNPILTGLFRAHAAIPRRLFTSGRAFRPLHLAIEVTYRCNLRCNFCQYLDIIEGSAEHIGPVKEFTFEQICRAIEQFPRGRLITFSGGETLMRKDFPDILAHACRRHRAHVISNGALITEAIASRYVGLAPRRVWQRGLVLVGISLEGSAEVHDRIVGRPGSWQRTMLGVDALVRARRDARKSFPKLGMLIVVTRDTVGGLVDFVRLAADRGMDIVNFITEHSIVPHSGTLTSHPLDDRIRLPQPRPEGVDAVALRDELEAAFALAAGRGLEVKSTPAGLPIREFVRHYTEDRALSADEYVCGAAWSRLAIGADGRYTPACPYLRVGDARTGDLREVWNGGELTAFRRRIARDRVYAGCSGCCNLQYMGPRGGELEGEPQR